MTARERTGWPLIESDLPPAPDPNYCVESKAALDGCMGDTAAHKPGCLIERTSGQKCDCGVAQPTTAASVMASEQWPNEDDDLTATAAYEAGDE